MPKRTKNQYNERRTPVSWRIDAHLGVRIIRIFGTGSSLALDGRDTDKRGGPGSPLPTYSSRSKDLERTEPPYLHTPPISMPCSPLPPPSTAPNPGVASFHRPCSMQITIFPCYSFGYEKYMPFLHQNNLLLPARTCFPDFSTPSSTHLCNFQFLVVGVTT